MNNLDFNFFCKGCTKGIDYRKANCFTHYRIKHFKQGEQIAYRGEEVKELSILVEGTISVTIVLDSGLPLTTRERKAPFPLGAVALFADDNFYRVDIVSNGDSTLLTVCKDAVESQMCECRNFMRNFIAYNTTMLDVFSQHLSLLTHKTLKGKLAHYIVMSCEGESNDFRFTKSIEELAIYLCVERPSLSRAISQLSKDGIINYNRGCGEILNRKSLEILLL